MRKRFSGYLMILNQLDVAGNSSLFETNIPGNKTVSGYLPSQNYETQP